LSSQKKKHETLEARIEEIAQTQSAMIQTHAVFMHNQAKLKAKQDEMYSDIKTLLEIP